jgi:hypothetical protein
VIVCLSAEVDLVAGLVISAAGIDALRHADNRKEVAIAALPVLLGAHQLIEAVAWWGLQGRVPATAGDIAVWVYLLLAFGVLPLFVPVAIALLEPDAARMRAMRHLAVMGGAVSLVLVATMVRGPVEATIGGRYIAYEIGLSHGGLVVAAYVAATCGALLMSSHQVIMRFGMFNAVAVGVLTWLNTTGFASLWCAWAAVASMGIAFGLRSGALVSEHSSRLQHRAAS